MRLDESGPLSTRRDSYLVVAPGPLAKEAEAAFGAALLDQVTTLPAAYERLRAQACDAVFVAVDIAEPDPMGTVRELRAICPQAIVHFLVGRPQLDRAIVLGTLEQVRMTRDNKRLTEQLLRREKLTALGRLVGGLCHELNNPLAFILSNSENLREYAADLKRVIEAYQGKLFRAGLSDASLQELEAQIDLPFVLDDAERAARDASTGAKRLRELIIALRHYAGDGGEIVATDLRKVGSQALAILAKAVRDRASLEFTSPAVAVAQANASAVTQVIAALVTNALESFGDRSTSQNHIKVTIEPRADRIAIVIEDNGPGVPPELVERIFDPFFSTKQPGKGMGLGLSVAARIAMEHHGELVLEPSAAGARFAFVMPTPAA